MVMGVESTICVDRISELPEYIIHHILSFLNDTKMVARTCILSKKWHRIWETFPILVFDEKDFGEYLNESNPRGIGLSKDERRSLFHQRAKFISYVDNKLRRFVEDGLRVKMLRLCMTLVNINLAPRVDTWIDELVTSLKVQELWLQIHVGKHGFYSLPPKVFACPSLTKLTLDGNIHVGRNCFSSGDAIKFNSLVELHLDHAYLDDETLQSLMSCCRSMEVFCLNFSVGFERLEFHGLPNLKKMKLSSSLWWEIEGISIEAPSLEDLEICIRGARKTVELEVSITSICRKLKTLCLEGMPTSTKWLQKTISRVPQLELLSLINSPEQVLKLSSSALKEIIVCNPVSLVEAEFDTPNLQRLTYQGRDLPRFSSNDVGEHRATLIILARDGIGDSWFIRFSNFLRWGRFQHVDLIITSSHHEQDVEITFNERELMGLQPFLPYDIEKLRLSVNWLESNSPANLLDGLLCILHPKYLSLNVSRYSIKAVKGIVKRLAELKFCGPVLNVDGVNNGVQLDSSTCNSFIRLLDNWREPSRNKVWWLCFDLSW